MANSWANAFTKSGVRLSLGGGDGTLLQPGRNRLLPARTVSHGSGTNNSECKEPKQVQRRLGADDVDQLVADYLAGAKVMDLAGRFRISRNTVLEHVTRAGVRKHYPALIPEEVDEAAQLYRFGQSLVSVGERFGVNATTVRTALFKVGVEMRDCQGRKRPF